MPNHLPALARCNTYSIQHQYLPLPSCTLVHNPCCLSVTPTEFSIFPTLSYGLAEGKGDALSTSNGGWLNGEFGYNPINNNLGASVSAGTSNSANVGSAERIGQVNPGVCVCVLASVTCYVCLSWNVTHKHDACPSCKDMRQIALQLVTTCLHTYGASAYIMVRSDSASTWHAT